MQKWRAKVWTGVAVGMWSLSSYGAGPSVGLFVTKADPGGHRTQLCVKAMHDGRYDVAVFTVYCPSKECMNMRFGDMEGKAKAESNRIRLVEKKHCQLVITFSKNKARIKQDTESCSSSDEHTYLYADGLYKLIRSEVREEDCGPTGPHVCDPNDTSHKTCP